MTITIEVLASDLYDVLTNMASSTDKDRPGLSAVRVRPEGHKAEFVATNSFWVVSQKMTFEGKKVSLSKAKPFYVDPVPLLSTLKVAGAARRGRQVASLAFESEGVVLTVGDSTVRSKYPFAEGEQPVWDSILKFLESEFDGEDTEPFDVLGLNLKHLAKFAAFRLESKTCTGQNQVLRLTAGQTSLKPQGFSIGGQHESEKVTGPRGVLMPVRIH